MSEITPNVVLGDMGNASSDLFFKAWGITHILNCAVEHSTHKYPVSLPTFCLPLDDDEYPAVESLLLSAAGKLEEWTRQGYRVFVHCKAGISRSPAVVITWLRVYKKYSFDDAYCLVAKARPFIRPNPYFLKILKSL